MNANFFPNQTPTSPMGDVCFKTNPSQEAASGINSLAAAKLPQAQALTQEFPFIYTYYGLSLSDND